MHLLLFTLHILGGSVGLLAGTAAIAVRKGGKPHRTLGNVFTVAMLTLALTGFLIAVLRHQYGNMAGALTTGYLISTAWRAGRKPLASRGFDRIALAAGLVIFGAVLTLGLELLRHPLLDRSASAVMTLVFAAVLLLAAMGDLRMIRSGLSQRSRIARHAWRMCFGLFIATGSFFLGQQKVFPQALQGSPLLMVLGLLPLPLLVFWAARIRFGKAWRPANELPLRVSL